MSRLSCGCMRCLPIWDNRQNDYIVRFVEGDFRSGELSIASANCDPSVFVFVHNAGYHDVNSMDTIPDDTASCKHWSKFSVWLQRRE